MVATCVASSNIQIPFLLHLCCAVSGEKKLRYHQLCSLLEHRVNTEWSPAPPHLAPFLPRLGRTSMESHPSLCRFFRLGSVHILHLAFHGRVFPRRPPFLITGTRLSRLHQFCFQSKERCLCKLIKRSWNMSETAGLLEKI